MELSSDLDELRLRQGRKATQSGQEGGCSSSTMKSISSASVKAVIVPRKLHKVFIGAASAVNQEVVSPSEAAAQNLKKVAVVAEQSSAASKHIVDLSQLQIDLRFTLFAPK